MGMRDPGGVIPHAIEMGQHRTGTLRGVVQAAVGILMRAVEQIVRWLPPVRMPVRDRH